MIDIFDLPETVEKKTGILIITGVLSVSAPQELHCLCFRYIELRYLQEFEELLVPQCRHFSAVGQSSPRVQPCLKRASAHH